MNEPSSVVHDNSDIDAHMSTPLTEETCDTDLSRAIAQGVALRDITSGKSQDLTFLAGNRVFLLERLNDSGLCLGYCEGVIGRFHEADVDFKASPPPTPGEEPSSPLSSTAPHILPKGRSRATSATSAVSDKKTQDSEPVPRLRKKSSAIEEGNPLTSTLSRQTPMAAIAIDPNVSGRPVPRKLVSDENLKGLQSEPGASRWPILTSPPSPSQEQLSTNMPIIPPRSSSRQSKGNGSQEHSPGVRPLASKSSSTSMNSLADPNGSSATFVTNSLDIKSNDFATDHQRLSPVFQPQRSLPPSRKSSLSSKAIPHLQLQEQQEYEREQRHKEHDYTLSSMLDNLRAKANQVIQSTGFSMAPTAGLYADRGTENVDLRVIQMPPPSPSTIIAGMKAASSAVSSPVPGVSFAISTQGSGKTSGSGESSKKQGRPRSRSLWDEGRSSQSSAQSDTSAVPMPESPNSVFGRFRHWGKDSQRQRSNSGPARHSDPNLQEKMEALQAHKAQTPPLPRGESERSSRPRRTSETASVSGSSVATTYSCPPQHNMQAEQKADPNGHKNRPKHWFNIGRRGSIPLVDMRKPHALGHGIEGGIMGRQTATSVNEDEEDEDTDEEEEEEGRKSGENSRIYVNDYGFIYDLDDEMNQGHDLTGTGSSVGANGQRGSNISSASEMDRKREMKKLKFARENELKWIHAATRLQADSVKKSNKYKKLVRHGIPTSVRGRVWLFLAKADVYRKPGLFEELCKRGPLPIYEVIERDIHRCYPDHVHFRDNSGTGQQDLHSILRAYAHYKPDVGYCQGMGRLVGMMLMQMPTEDAFWLLVATIEDYMQDYYTPSLRQLRIDAQVFERLLKDQDPPLAEHLERNDVIPLMYMTQWFMTLYTMSLPWASVLRVWDVFYFDGVKALFRIGLAILHLCRDHLLNKCPSSSELLAYILHIPLENLAPKPLLGAALQIRLKKQSVQKLIASTAESMDAAVAATSSPPPSSSSSAADVSSAKRSVMTTTSNITSASNVSANDTDPLKTDSSHPGSPSSLSASTAIPPPSPASPSSSSFSLGVFKTRKRAGTIHK